MAVRGADKVKRNMKLVEDKMGDPSIRLAALKAAAFPLHGMVRRTAPRQMGDYARSINIGVLSMNPPLVGVGTDRPQALRLEFGFSGADALGRFFDQAPKPHWRPAIKTSKPQMQNEFSKAMAHVLKAATARFTT